MSWINGSAELNTFLPTQIFTAAFSHHWFFCSSCTPELATCKPLVLPDLWGAKSHGIDERVMELVKNPILNTSTISLKHLGSKLTPKLVYYALGQELLNFIEATNFYRTFLPILLHANYWLLKPDLKDRECQDQCLSSCGSILLIGPITAHHQAIKSPITSLL